MPGAFILFALLSFLFAPDRSLAREVSQDTSVYQQEHLLLAACRRCRFQGGVQSATVNPPSNEIWVNAQFFFPDPVSGTEAFYPDIDIDDDRVRDDYVAQLINPDNWVDIIATGKTVVFGMLGNVLDSMAPYIGGYTERPLTDGEISQLISFVDANNFKVSIELGGLRLGLNQKLIADVGCPVGDFSCAGEGRREANNDFNSYLKRWIDLGGRIDYIVTDHAWQFAATAIATPALNIQLDALHDASYITLVHLVEELLRYYQHSDTELRTYHESIGRPYPGIGFATIAGPSSFKVGSYPSRGGPSLLNTPSTVTFETVLDILGQKINSGAFGSAISTRSVSFTFDHGPQAVTLDGGSFASWEFERLITSESLVRNRSLTARNIIHPGAFAHGVDNVYTDAAVTCSGACDVSPSGVLGLANVMSHDLQMRYLKEYLQGGGLPNMIALEGWHRYPSAIGPSSVLSWFNTARDLIRLVNAGSSVLRAYTGRATGSLAAGSPKKVSRSLHLQPDPVTNVYLEDRYELHSVTSGVYETLDFENISTPVAQAGLSFSTRMQLLGAGAGWAAIHFGKSTSPAAVWQEGLSVLVGSDLSVVLGVAQSGVLQELARADAALPASRDATIGVSLEGLTVRVYVDYKKVIEYTLPASSSFVGIVSLDSFQENALFFNPVIDFNI